MWGPLAGHMISSYMMNMTCDKQKVIQQIKNDVNGVSTEVETFWQRISIRSVRIRL